MTSSYYNYSAFRKAIMLIGKRHMFINSENCYLIIINYLTSASVYIN